MRRLSNAITGVALISALALSGCGSSDSSSTANSREIAFGSPVLEGRQKIPAKYTCDGKDIALPLEWGSVPNETKELVIFLFGLKLINPGAGQKQVQAKLNVQWSVAGLNPGLKELPAGRLPHGALVGSNQRGGRRYSVCPAKGQAENYLFRIYALSQNLSLKHGISSKRLLEQIETSTLGYGEFIAGYKRV